MTTSPRTGARSRYVEVASVLFVVTSGSAACSSGPTAGPTEETETSPTTLASAAPASSIAEWRRAMSKTPTPKDGCFQASHPSTTWVEVPCTIPPKMPLLPRKGGNPEAVGDGTDATGNVLSTTPISTAEGSFPSVTGVTNEVDATANNYAIQLNTNTFGGAALCSGAANPAACRGWQQFIYQPGYAYIQYWLLNYGSGCPSGWTPYGGDCYTNSDGGASVPAEPITDLPNITMTATAGSVDGLTMTTGDGTIYKYSTKTSVLNLDSGGWTAAEFNVFGSSSLQEALFNPGASLTVRLLTESSPTTSLAPTCGSGGFTGETNNFILGSCTAFGGATPGIQFTESVPTSSKPKLPNSDYDGDGKSDIAVWNNSSATFYIRYSSGSGPNGTSPVAVPWGTTSDSIPVPGDYDGDGKTDIAVWNNSSATWFLSYSSGASPTTKSFGTTGDSIPIPGDYDSDGKFDFAVWNNSSATWFIWYIGTGTADPGVAWGTTGDSTPIAGDYDGDGRTDLTVWNNSSESWFIYSTITGAPFAPALVWGTSGDSTALPHPLR